MFGFRSVIIVIVLCCSSWAAQAQSLDVRTIDAELARGNWNGAIAAAERLDSKSTSDFYGSYVAAHQLIAAGDCARALDILGVLVLIHPNFLPARQLSYLCREAIGDLEGAKAELDAMLALLTEGPQRETVVALRRRLLLKQGPVFDVFGGIVPSTNLNRATTQTTVGIFTVPESSRARAGIKGNLGASVAFAMFDEGMISGSFVMAGQVEGSTLTNLLSPALTLSTPMTFRPSDKVVAVLTPSWGIDFDGTAIESFRAGATLASSFGVTDQLSVSASVAADLWTYPTAAYRDGVKSAAVVGVGYSVTPTVYLSAKGLAVYDSTFDPLRRTLLGEATARVDWAAPLDLLVAGEVAVGKRLHSEPPPLSTGPNQTDTYVRARAELSSLALNVGPFRPALFYEYNRQASDNVFYDYTSHDVGITLKGRL